LKDCNFNIIEHSFEVQCNRSSSKHNTNISRVENNLGYVVNQTKDNNVYNNQGVCSFPDIKGLGDASVKEWVPQPQDQDRMRPECAQDDHLKKIQKIVGLCVQWVTSVTLPPRYLI
jgi:hypothetical protein